MLFNVIKRNGNRDLLMIIQREFIRHVLNVKKEKKRHGTYCISGNYVLLFQPTLSNTQLIK